MLFVVLTFLHPSISKSTLPSPVWRGWQNVWDLALAEMRHMTLTLPVCVCFCSHAKLRCMCTCNRCTFCICHNLLNSELVRSVKAKLYSAVLTRFLSIALLPPILPLCRAFCNFGFLTRLSFLLTRCPGLTVLGCISTEGMYRNIVDFFWCAYFSFMVPEIKTFLNFVSN